MDCVDPSECVHMDIGNSEVAEESVPESFVVSAK